MNNQPEKKPKKNKRHLIIWAICFAVPTFIATLYIMYIVVIAFLFSTRSIHGSNSPFPYGIYIIPWIVAIITAIPFALIGTAVGKRFSEKKVNKLKIINVVIFIILIVAIIACVAAYAWQRTTNQALQNEIVNLNSEISGGEKIILPKYVSYLNIPKIIRSEKNSNYIYAISERPSLLLFDSDKSKYYEEFTKSFIGIIKSNDNGKNWDQIYEVENDIIDLAVSNKNLYSIIISRYGGGSEEIYIKVATSQDGGGSWSESKEIAKNDTDDQSQSQPFTLNSISNIIVDSNNPNKSYILYKENFASESYDKMIYTEDFWDTWQRKDL